jgi:hypothetical protein
MLYSLPKNLIPCGIKEFRQSMVVSLQIVPFALVH